LTISRALDQVEAGTDSTSHPASERPPLKTAQNFVGREFEIKRLEEHFESMLAGSGKLVFLSGEAGMGKSSLAERFVKSIRSRYPELRVAAGHSVEQYGPGESYLPFLDALSGLLREHGIRSGITYANKPRPGVCNCRPSVREQTSKR
jgi:predicted ATP-dependent serine protease